MKFRFRKSKKILPGVKINITNRGVSANVGPKGSNIGIGKRGVHGNVSVPKTGISGQQKLAGGCTTMIMKLVSVGVILLSLILFAMDALGQVSPSITELQAKAKAEKMKHLILTYDKFKDRSTVTTKPQNLISSNEGAMAIFGRGMIGPGAGAAQTVLLIGFEHRFKGDKLTSTADNFAIIFRSSSSGFVYLKGDKNLYLLMDEERLEIKPVDTDHDLKFGLFNDLNVNETLLYEITRKDLERLVKSKKVELKLGDTKPRKLQTNWSERIQQVLVITKID